MIRYAHTNLVARDWRRLADFYVRVFDCVPVSSERDHRGAYFEALTGLSGSCARGRHLRLPGFSGQGPTLEIFQFDPHSEELPRLLDRPGLAHLAFEVDDVDAKRREVLAEGGDQLGDQITIDIPGAGRLTLVYVRDPEGNIVEVQHWHQEQTAEAAD